jgi:cell division inhibitor SepF
MAGSMRKAFQRLGLASVEEEEWDYPEEGGERLADVTPIKRGAPEGSFVDALPDGMHRIATREPRSYGEAKTVGEPYREGIPVIMNLSSTNDVDSQRMVDFAGGLTYALHGRMERITSRVFLLSPPDMAVDSAGEDRRRGYYAE